MLKQLTHAEGNSNPLQVIKIAQNERRIHATQVSYKFQAVVLMYDRPVRPLGDPYHLIAIHRHN
jgi:hypothetical protein